MGGNTKQHLGTLRIEERGTIDWVGGKVGQANMLWLDSLEFSSTDARLFMRHWYEFEDYLLIRKTGLADFSILNQITFEGYDGPAITRDYDQDYYQITPFLNRMPEPSTYGAILGAVGIGLWTWRKRRKKSVSPNETGH